MKFKLIVGVLALGVVGALVFFPLPNRQGAASDADQKSGLNPSGQTARTNAHEEVNAATKRKPANMIKGKRFLPAVGHAERTACAESPNREAVEENEREGEELQGVRNEIAKLKTEVREGRLDLQRERLRRATKKLVTRTRQTRQGAPNRQVRMPGGAIGVPTDIVDDGKDIQQPPSLSTGNDESLDQPAVADPINPKPGMIFKGYNVKVSRDMFELASQLEKSAAVKTTVVNGEKFSLEDFKDVHVDQGVWEGFLKCKRTANCTILAQQGRIEEWGFAIEVNGKRFMAENGQLSNTINLKAGFNHFKVITQHGDVFISLKATGSAREPKPITPKNMFYDEKPDEVIEF